MRYGCPNKHCNFYQKKDPLIKDGKYYRTNDSRWIQRYKCKSCGRRFSNATFSLAKGQKKRRVNKKIEELLCSSVSMRRTAILCGVHRTTVKRKVDYLAKVAKKEQGELLKNLEVHKVEHMQFDDILTIEHTKLKPLSITLAVDAKTRLILGAKVSQIPAFGLLAKTSRKKYGYRESLHKEGIEKLFDEIKKCVKENALIESDKHKLYGDPVKENFPGCQYKQYKGGRGCVAGQGELKKLNFDPLFSLNHTCAMLRANINRLVRRTWCTTKDPKMLQKHLDIYINFHNQRLLSG